jgi:hypothetical protein
MPDDVRVCEELLLAGRKEFGPDIRIKFEAGRDASEEQALPWHPEAL